MKNYHVGYLDVDGDPVAVFTDSAADCRPGNIMVYARMGEHAEADIAWVRQQPLASLTLSAPLHEYLARRYSDPPGECEAVNLVIDQGAVPR